MNHQPKNSQPTTKMKPKSMCTQIDLLRRKALMLISIAVKYHRYMYVITNWMAEIHYIVSAANLRYIDCYAEKRVVDYIIVSKAKKHSLAHTMVNEELSILYMGTALLFFIIIIIITIWEYTMFNVTKANSYWLIVEARNGLNLAIT